MSGSTLPRSALYCLNFNYFLQHLNIRFFGAKLSLKNAIIPLLILPFHVIAK